MAIEKLLELGLKQNEDNIIDEIYGYTYYGIYFSVKGIENYSFIVHNSKGNGVAANRKTIGITVEKPKSKFVGNLIEAGNKFYVAGFIKEQSVINNKFGVGELENTNIKFSFKIEDEKNIRLFNNWYEQTPKSKEISDRKTKSRSGNRGREEYIYFYKYEEVKNDPAKIKLIGMELEDKTNVFIEDEDAHEDVLKPFRFKDLLKGVKKTDQDNEEEEEKEYETGLFEMTVSLFDFMDEEKKKKIKEIENKVNKKEEIDQNESRIVTYYSKMRSFFESATEKKEKKIGYDIVFQKPKVNHGISAVRMKINNLEYDKENFSVELANKRLYIGNDIRKEIIKKTNEFFKDYEGILKLQDNIDNIKIEDFDIEKLNKDIEKFTDLMEQSVKNINEILYRGYLGGESSLDDPMHVKFRDITREVVKEKYKQIINSDKLKELKKIGFNDDDLDLSNKNKRTDYNK